MIDKVNNITSGNTQNKRSVDENRVNKSVRENKATSVKESSSDFNNVKISQELEASS